MDDVDEINDSFVIFTYTDGLGKVPKQVELFMEKYHDKCIGVLCSGNRNFGSFFCGAGVILSKKYNIPLLHAVDLRGYEDDWNIIEKKYKSLRGEYWFERIFKIEQRSIKHI